MTHFESGGEKMGMHGGVSGVSDHINDLPERLIALGEALRALQASGGRDPEDHQFARDLLEKHLGRNMVDLESVIHDSVTIKRTE